MTKQWPEPREGYVAVGRVLRPWGLRGDLKVESMTDFPDRFEDGQRLWLAGREHVVEASRWQKGLLYLKLRGIDDPDDAEPFRDELLEVPEDALHPLDEDEFYHHQLTGLQVNTTADEPLGEVVEVLATGGNAVLVVRGPLGEVLLPFIDDVIRAVDLPAGRITVELIDGLLTPPSEKPRREFVPRWARKRIAARGGPGGAEQPPPAPLSEGTQRPAAPLPHQSPTSH